MKEPSLEQAIRRIRSLHEGDLGVVDVVAFGPAAVPRLRALLFEREPSGLFATRCRVVEALAALGARDVLVDFLATHRDAADPVERLGDDALVNATARALARFRDEAVFRLLLELAERRLQPGVVAALASFERKETIPYLIAALAEDECRRLAEAGLERLGPAAHDALAAMASAVVPPDQDSPSRMRQRHSALGLLAKAANQPMLLPAVRDGDTT